MQVALGIEDRLRLDASIGRFNDDHVGQPEAGRRDQDYSCEDDSIHSARSLVRGGICLSIQHSQPRGECDTKKSIIQR
jgi:hypothetical protein